MCLSACPTGVQRAIQYGVEDLSKGEAIPCGLRLVLNGSLSSESCIFRWIGYTLPTSACNMAKDIKNNTMPPPTRKDAKLVPIQTNNVSPINADISNTIATVNAVTRTILLRSIIVWLWVRESRIGIAINGSTMTTRAVNSLVYSVQCSIIDY